MAIARIIAAGLAASLTGCLPAMADQAFSDCVDRDGATNADWARCGVDYQKREDKQLNAAWDRLLAKVPDEFRAGLVAEQRAWIAFKDRSCSVYVNGALGREGQVLHLWRCRAAVIVHRRQELEATEKAFDGEP